MKDYYIPEQPTEKAFLVGVNIRGSRPLLSVESSLEELSLLADTAGMVVVGQASQNVQNIDPATFVGAGKVEEIRESLESTQAKVVIFDDELSPRHQRELEKRLGQEIKVLDRSALILDIFAQHAQTREGSLQVELAQYEYRLPRLTRQWTHLARQAGGGGSRSGNAGVGLRGPGETQLEVDRREIGRKIAKLKDDLEQVRQHRSRYRMQRTRTGIPVVSIVGYTNAGKSTLLKTLTGADVYTADQVFATLDPTTRKITLPSNREILLTDTVGFIQKLPTTLIAAFRATLEEVAEADLLLHVVDVSHPNVLQHIESVEDTLAEIDVPAIPRILVWNKIDRWDGETMPSISEISDGYDMEVAISAHKAVGIPTLLDAIESVLQRQLCYATLLLPYQRGDLVAQLFTMGNVESQEHTQDGVLLKVQMPQTLYGRFKEYEVKGE
ncbi:MAG: GTPase HflX [Anaerolineae bacterium]